MSVRLVVTDEGLGRLTDHTVELLRTDYFDLGAALRDGATLREISEADVIGEVGIEKAQLLPPIGKPEQLWAVGLNYADHVAEISGAKLSEPFIFPKATSAIIGDGQPIRIPGVAADSVDFEGEMAIVIGRRARNIAATDAWSYVAGVTICNDVSARSVQKGGPGIRANISMAKSFDSFAPLGPAVAMVDTLKSRDSLGLRTYVNDELRQSASTSQMIFDVPELLAFLTERVTLQPGDVIATGTPEGVGDVDGRFLKPGDVVRIELDEVGVLSNSVTSA